MALCYMSKLDDSEKTYLDYDPITYGDAPPERRMSSHATMGGGMVWQDFGVEACDRSLPLHTDYMSQATLDAFIAKFNVTAGEWKWHDHKGHEYKVVFRELKPERIQGHEAYRVDMLLEIRQVLV